MTRLLCAVAILVLAAPAAGSTQATINVYAAASLTEVFPRIDTRPRYSFAGSDQLATQIRQGAPADVFAAASTKQPEDLYREGLVRKPYVFATNSLVVIVPRPNPAHIRTVYDLKRKGVRVVIGDASVPVGVYTRKLLHTLGIENAVLKNVVSEEPDVKGIVAKVALGEADAGFVYRTDARSARTKVATVGVPARAQPSIRYELAVLRSTHNLSGARAFVRRVLSDRGRRRLLAAGFGVPKRR